MRRWLLILFVAAFAGSLALQSNVSTDPASAANAFSLAALLSIIGWIRLFFLSSLPSGSRTGHRAGAGGAAGLGRVRGSLGQRQSPPPPHRATKQGVDSDAQTAGVQGFVWDGLTTIATEAVGHMGYHYEILGITEYTVIEGNVRLGASTTELAQDIQLALVGHLTPTAADFIFGP